ncbi:MAG TPA: alpha/beta hydrolase [Clostridiales bacterium]|nr:alpha/beta hydrolase [Clostridiales bacterium]
MQKIIAFFMAIIMFFAQLFGIKPIKKFQNISYGADKNQSISLTIPYNAKGDYGMMVFIHGGGWTGGNKEEYWGMTKAAAQDYGIVGLTIGYRLLTEGGDVDFNTMMSDIQKAIEKAIEKSAQEGVNITKIGIGGYSAGGHLSLSYAYKCVDECPVPIKFVFTDAGPTDMNDPNWLGDDIVFSQDYVVAVVSELTNTNITLENKDSEESKAALAAVSPISYITPSSVPTIIVHGKKDNVVPFSNAESLDEALTFNGVQHEFFILEKSDHGLSNDPEIRNAATQKLENYVNTYLK